MKRVWKNQRRINFTLLNLTYIIIRVINANNTARGHPATLHVLDPFPKLY